MAIDRTLEDMEWRPPLLSIGEVMLEFSLDAENRESLMYSMSVAGDVFNTAVSLSRLGIHTGFFTRLGDDRMSRHIINTIDKEGVNSTLVQLLPRRLPGLYLIDNDDLGERRFDYWRSESPARDMFSSNEDAEILWTKASHYRTIYLTGITIAILKKEARNRLFDFLNICKKAGKTVVMDSNYREALWENEYTAQSAILDLAAVSDVSLISLDDERALWGQECTATEVSARYHEKGVTEVVVKSRAAPVLVSGRNFSQEIPVDPVKNIVDATGAGDAFNAGYIFARFKGYDLINSVKLGCGSAAAVLRHSGAIGDRQKYLEELDQLG